MKVFAIAATALLASVTYAAPALVEARNPASVAVNFFGAADAEFTQNFPADGSIQKITNQLSVSQIQIPVSGYTGIFWGKDGSVTTVIGPNSSPVGPPQVQVSGKVYHS